jgi:hypothetical protein
VATTGAKNTKLIQAQTFIKHPKKEERKQVNDTSTLVHKEVGFPRGDSSLDKKSQIGSWWVSHGGK